MNTTTAMLEMAKLLKVSPDEKPDEVVKALRRRIRQHLKFKDTTRRRLIGILEHVDDALDSDFDPELRKLQSPKSKPKR